MGTEKADEVKDEAWKGYKGRDRVVQGSLHWPKPFQCLPPPSLKLHASLSTDSDWAVGSLAPVSQTQLPTSPRVGSREKPLCPDCPQQERSLVTSSITAAACLTCTLVKYAILSQPLSLFFSLEIKRSVYSWKFIKILNYFLARTCRGNKPIPTGTNFAFACFMTPC